MLTPAQAHQAVVREWTTVLDALTPLDDAGWATPTRCAGWTLTDLARHAAWGTSMEADALARARAGSPGSGEGVEPTEWIFAALRTSIGALDHQLGRAGGLGPTAMVTIPFGEIPVGFALAVFTMEAGIHADDVATALAARHGGADPELAADVVDATVAVLTVVLPALAEAAGADAESPPPGTSVVLRGSTVVLAFTFRGGVWKAGDPASTPPDASTVSGDDTAVLRYALGRTGADDPRLTLTGDAAAFKRWFPGP